MASSHSNKFTPGTIQMLRGGMGYFEPRPDIPAYVESVDNSNEAPDTWRYSITIKRGEPAFYVDEARLRTMTKKEYAWFKHPKDGKWMCGRTEGWMAIIIHIAFVTGSTVCLSTVGKDAAWTGMIPLVLMVVGFWRYTMRNYSGKTR